MNTWVYGCFFVSGVSALIYEVAWLQQIQMVMGHTTHALVTTLCAYLSGLALGAWYTPRLLKTKYNPLFLYLAAEFLIGVYGFLFTPILKLVQMPYQFIMLGSNYPLTLLSLIQFLFCGLVIVVPTFLMGTTLPLLSSFLFTQKNEISEKVPGLYAINTLGATVGSFASGFIILPALGYQKSVLLAAAMNISLLLIMKAAWNLNPRRDHEISPTPTLVAMQNQLIHSRDTGRTWSLAILFLSGLVSMVMQTVWCRLGALNFGSTVYIFPLVTTVVLTGIVLGSKLWSIVRQSTAYVWLPAIAGVAILFSTTAFAYSSYIVFWWNKTINPGFWLKTLFQLLLCIVCLLPAATCIGTLFPAALSRLSSGLESDGGTRSVGIGYSVNILGMIFGATLTSFILFPVLGIENITTWLGLILIFLGSVIAFVQLGSWELPTLSVMFGLLTIVLLPKYDWGLLNSGFFLNRHRDLIENLGTIGIKNEAKYIQVGKNNIRYHKDDPSGSLAVIDNVEDNTLYSRSFLINGKPDGTWTYGQTGNDLVATRVVSLLPVLARQKIQSALIIGLGIGSSVGQLLRHPRLEKLDVVEISSSVIRMAREYFSEILEEGRFWNDPRLTVINRDGRNFLENTRETYDLIMSEPTHLWVEGVASLYTLEFFQTIAKKLNQDGILSLWFHAYDSDCETVFSVLKTLFEVFPTYKIFFDGTNIYVLATQSQNEIELFYMPDELISLEQTLFRELGIDSRNRTAAYQQLVADKMIQNVNRLKNKIERYTVNSDDNMYVQFRLAKYFFDGASCHNYFISELESQKPVAQQ